RSFSSGVIAVPLAYLLRLQLTTYYLFLMEFLQNRDAPGISFIDSTSLKVCHNRRISQHRVFKDIAARGKTSVDWFFGFKLHLVVNEQGELLNLQITPGNVDDRKPVPDLLESLFGKVFALQRICLSTVSYPVVYTIGD
ncbi:transposase, partial [Funiculus sociatus GB2-C1]|uniref:transposase n=1 Tax=Trichocoleus sp. FACHB-69 TaxID=2692874 RepID=UPI001F550CB7